MSKGFWDKLHDGFIREVGWSFGVTIGFTIVSSILVVVLNALGGLPLVGGWIAGIVEATQAYLQNS